MIADNDSIATSVKTWVLQVYVPSSYRTPQDADELQTMFLGYIPTSSVDELAAQLKVKSSAFYTGTNDAVAQALAQRVDSSFSVLSVPAPDDSSSNGSAASSSENGGSSSSSRQDAIIGVTVSLGVIAVLILAYLVYRSHQKRQEAKHRRLSDPIDPNGVRPEGRDFDQDSVGGQRRRSFYFAEDSLRGFQEQQQEQYSYYAQGQGQGQGGWDARSGESQMSQRRPVMPSAISAPILRESSMNW